jgi:hypothetical protein
MHLFGLLKKTVLPLWVATLTIGIGIAHADDTSTIQTLINTANQTGACAVQLPAATYHVTTLKMQPCVRLLGDARDLSSKLGTVIIGTPGYDTITLPQGSPFEISHLSIKGGLNALRVPSTIGYASYLTLNDDLLNGTNAGLEVDAPLEEFYADRVYFSSGNFGISQTGHSYIQKSHIVNSTFNGQAINGIYLTNDGSLVDMAIEFGNDIVQMAGQDGIYVNAPICNLRFVQLSTEHNNSTNSGYSDVEFGATGFNMYGITFEDSALIGTLTKYSINRPQTSLVLMNTITSPTIYNPNKVSITQIGYSTKATIVN